MVRCKMARARAQLDSQVAARHHDRSERCTIASSRSIAAGFSSFDSTIAWSPISARASSMSSGRCTNDSATSPRHPTRAQVLAVLFGQRRDRQHHARDVHALAVAQAPPTHGVTAWSRRTSRPRCRRRHRHNVASRSGREDSAAGRFTAPGVAFRLDLRSAGRFPGAARLRAGERRPAALGPCQARSIPTGRPNSRPIRRAISQRPVLVGRAMAEIEPEHVNAGLEQRADVFGRARRPRCRRSWRCISAAWTLAPQKRASLSVIRDNIGRWPIRSGKFSTRCREKGRSWGRPAVFCRSRLHLWSRRENRATRCAASATRSSSAPTARVRALRLAARWPDTSMRSGRRRQAPPLHGAHAASRWQVDAALTAELHQRGFQMRVRQ